MKFKTIPDDILHELREKYDEYSFESIDVNARLGIRQGLIMKCVHSLREANPGVNFHPVLAEKNNHKILSVVAVTSTGEIELKMPSRLAHGKYNVHTKERDLRYTPVSNHGDQPFSLHLLVL